VSTSKITSDLLRGNTDTMILRLLAEADRCGYEIVKLIAERSQGEYELKEATMYSSVWRLEADGDITWYWGRRVAGRAAQILPDHGKRQSDLRPQQIQLGVRQARTRHIAVKGHCR
jgi:DNA-binding PadR family transcriptional regulator